jgi:hypothetical protein
VKRNAQILLYFIAHIAYSEVSLLYLFASYLQYMLSTGKGYDNFGLILSAATLVPLQGFWNTFVYIRPRYLSNILDHVASFICRIASFVQRGPKRDAIQRSASETWQQSASDPQLHIVQVDESAINSASDEVCYGTTPPNKTESDDTIMDTTPKDNLCSKLHDEDRTGVGGFSPLSGHDLNVKEENIDIKEPLRTSPNNNTSLNQEREKIPDIKESSVDKYTSELARAATSGLYQ